MPLGGSLCVRSVDVEWEIDNFFQLPKVVNYRLRSPCFTFSNTKWYLLFFPNGTTRYSGSKWFALYLGRESPLSAVTITFTIGIKKADGSVFRSFSGTCEFDSPDDLCGNDVVIEISQFQSLKDIVDRNGTLRVFCSAYVDYKKPALHTSLPIADHTLSENFKDLFQSQYEADTTVKVGDREFLVHKLVLATRSTIFRAMFDADMVEKNESVINIEDCEPCHFEDFLLFLYSGQFDIVKSNNAFQLYIIADKYNVLLLKRACFETLKREISLESVLDVLCLATLYNEVELLNTATIFFMENKAEIVSHPNWFSFLSEHTDIANELIVKLVNNC